MSMPSVVASSSYTVSAEGYPDYTANAITSDEAAAAYREAAAGDADGSGNVGGTSTASQTTTVSSNDIASTEHEFRGAGTGIPKVKNTITLTITDTDGNATTRTIEQTGPKLLGEEEVRLEQAVAPDESTVTTCGRLYAILGNDSNEQDFMYYYDASRIFMKSRCSTTARTVCCSTMTASCGSPPPPSISSA